MHIPRLCLIRARGTLKCHQSAVRDNAKDQRLRHTVLRLAERGVYGTLACLSFQTHYYV